MPQCVDVTRSRPGVDGAGEASPGNAGDADPGAWWRRTAATIAPVALPGFMHVVFRSAIGRFGPRRGYQAGFAAYWTTCWAAAAAIAGPRRIAGTFRTSRRPLPAPRALARAALALPPIGAVTTELLPHARAAGPAAIGTSIFVGTTNALAEEAFWRALPVTLFPDDAVRGWLWPAACFTAWHLVPLTAAGSGRRRAAAVLTGAALIGAGYGWIAWQTRSVIPTLGPHVVTDASGVRTASRLWSRGE